MLAMALIGAGLNVYFRESAPPLPLLFQLWMFATPVFYPVSKVMDSHLPEIVKKLYLLNPMASIIDSFRRVVLKGEQPDYSALLLSLLVSVVLLFVVMQFSSGWRGNLPMSSDHRAIRIAIVGCGAIAERGHLPSMGSLSRES